MSEPEAQRIDDDPMAAYRVGTYALLARVLGRAPDAEALRALREAPAGHDEDALGQAWAELATAARVSDPDTVERRHHQLLVGIAHGEISPHASWYQQGALMGQTLAELRGELQRLGLERQDGAQEPEDHIAMLCEAMAWLIREPSHPLTEERAFFQAFLEPWAGRMFSDLEAAAAEDPFFGALGRLGQAFMQVEARYYAMRR